MLEKDEDFYVGIVDDLDEYHDYSFCDTKALPCDFCDYAITINGCLRCSNGKCAFFD